MKVQFFIVVQTDFSWFFHEKYMVRCLMEVRESWMPCFFVSVPTIKYYPSITWHYISVSLGLTLLQAHKNNFRPGLFLSNWYLKWFATCVPRPPLQRAHFITVPSKMTCIVKGSRIVLVSRPF